MILYKEAGKKPKANCLFMPGVPGRIKDFAIFDDLIKENINVYFHQYPGTHGTTGEFSYKTAIASLRKSISELDKKGTPLILIAYSFSTLAMFNFDFSKYKNIISLCFFSPIRGLDRSSIDEDFLESLKALAETDDYKIVIAAWKKTLPETKIKNVKFNLKKLSDLNFPVVFAYSLNDKTVKIEIFDQELERFRNKYGYGTFLVIRSREGYHKLDSYHTAAISNYIKALMIKEDMLKLLGRDASLQGYFV